MEPPCIQWDPAYSVHIEALDAEHRELFDVVNRLVDRFESGSGDVLPALGELVQYLNGHFHAENVVMLNAQYPDFYKHSQDHQRFTEKMHEFFKDCKAGRNHLASDMISYLVGWIRNHTLHLDRQYGEYILKKRSVS